ncbi:MAG TPA: hypothetical protein OIM63_00305 [Bacilli bacterium]|nr:hypothetical protein [Bacilli bacterium]
MKKDIEYYYNIKIDHLEQLNNCYFFKYNNENYYFVLLNRPEEDLKEILIVCEELKNKGILCHNFMLNKDKKIVTIINNINYVMLKPLQNEKEELDLIDITNIQNNLLLKEEKSKLYRNDWARLWSEKIDYFEYQIREIGKDKKLILNSFSYYIGLAENAISYVNNVNETYQKEYLLTLCHKRVYYPTYKLNYYNPLSFIFDLRVRDIASYLKNKFFKKEDAYIELENYLKHIKLSNYEYAMLYARLLYPSYYFDIYEKVMNNEENEDKLVEIISLVDEYEEYLKQVYLLISKYSYIDSVDWIMKKDVKIQ